jgi:hypothetical protein
MSEDLVAFSDFFRVRILRQIKNRERKGEEGGSCKSQKKG